MGQARIPIWLLFGLIFGGLFVPDVLNLNALLSLVSLVCGPLIFYYLDQYLQHREARKHERE